MARTVGALLVVEFFHNMRWVVAALGGKQMTIQFPGDVETAIAAASAILGGHGPRKAT